MLREASEVVTMHTLSCASVPERVMEAVRSFWNMSTEPNGTLSGEASQETLETWVEELLPSHGFHTSAFLYTDLELAPWIEFSLAGAWFSSIRQAKDTPWVFLAHDLNTVAAVSEQEYRFEFFVARVA
jgi:hypothetical protein